MPQLQSPPSQPDFLPDLLRDLLGFAGESFQQKGQQLQSLQPSIDRMLSGQAAPDEMARLLGEAMQIGPGVAGKIIEAIAQPTLQAFLAHPVARKVLEALEAHPKPVVLSASTPARMRGEPNWWGMFTRPDWEKHYQGHRINLEYPTILLNKRSPEMHAPFSKPAPATAAHEGIHALDLLDERNLPEQLSESRVALVRRVMDLLSPESFQSMTTQPAYTRMRQAWPRSYQSEVLAHGMNDIMYGYGSSANQNRIYELLAEALKLK